METDFCFLNIKHKPPSGRVRLKWRGTNLTYNGVGLKPTNKFQMFPDDYQSN